MSEIKRHFETMRSDMNAVTTLFMLLDDMQQITYDLCEHNYISQLHHDNVQHDVGLALHAVESVMRAPRFVNASHALDKK